MKISQTRFIIIFFSFAILYSLNLNISEKGYYELDLNPGENEFEYSIPSNISYEEGKSPFISFAFSADNISFTIKENQELTPNTIPKNKWESLFLTVLAQKLINNFTFVINNENSEEAKMFFIDNSKEINITFDKFLSWKYDIGIRIEKYTPTSLIFAINEIKKDTKLNVKNNNNDDLFLFFIAKFK